MGVAAITVCYNDGYKLKEWFNNYLFYKDSIDKLIIVDNGSEIDFLEKLKELFKDAIVIERKKNGGCTAAYNDGIRMALSDDSIDAIMLIGNDIKISSESVSILYNLLIHFHN